MLCPSIQKKGGIKMTAERIWQMINSNEGIWMVNEEGFFLKAWSEAGDVIVRAYCKSDGDWCPWTYRSKPEHVIVSEKDGEISFELDPEEVSSIGEATCDTDRRADAEFRQGVKADIRVKSSLALDTGTSVYTTPEENAELIAFIGMLSS